MKPLDVLATMLCLAVLAVMLCLCGCATRLSPPILSALDCTKLVPPSYGVPVPPTPLPSPTATAGDLWVALDGQTTALDQANGRVGDLIGIMRACQAQQAAVLAALNPKPWWERLLPAKKTP